MRVPLLGALLVVAAPSSAVADEPAASQAPLEVEVQGERADMPRTGASVSVVTRQMINDLPGGDTQPLSHVIATQPGFVADTFAFGVHARAADGGLVYVIDGIPLPAAPLTAWGAAGGFIPLRLMESLRIITGGFPAEYGAGLGAVIDIQTKHAIGGPAGEVKVAYGTYNTADISFNYSQAIGKFGVLVGGTFQTTQRGLDPPAATPILHDAMLAGSGFARVDYEPTAHDRIEALGSWTVNRYQIPVDPTLQPLSAAPAGAVRGPDMYGNAQPPFIPYGANPIESERNVFAALSYRTTSDERTLQVSPFMREAYSRLSCDPQGSLGPTADPGSTCNDMSRDVYHGGTLVDVTWGGGEHHAWKAGALVDVAESNASYTSYTRDDGSRLGGPNPALTLSGSDVTDVLTAALYLQDRITLGNWTIFPGARLDLEHASYLTTSEPALLLAGPSARLGASYAATENVVVHAFAGYLWAAPNVIDGPAAARVLVPQLAHQELPVDLKGEKDWAGEVGIKGRVLDAVTLGLTGWGHYSIDQLDRQSVGTTDLFVTYNYAQGRSAGVEASTSFEARYLNGFANLGWQVGQGQGVSSERFLFTPAQLAYTGWTTLDHVQTWTANVGFDLHDQQRRTHLSGFFNYGSGMRTGPVDNETVPSHATLDLTIRHRLDLMVQPEVALDVLNVFDDVYAYRIANGNVGSAFGPLRRINVRVTVALRL
jgi:outer membrane cobalamin receptor